MSQVSSSSRTLPKVQIEIEIQEITNFALDKKGSSVIKPLWLEINPFKLYDEFSIGFKGGKVETW